MKLNIQQGYLLLADISGFSSFMEKTEIEHSARILNDQISLLINGLSPVMEIAEVEGDAVFAYVSSAKITRGELLLEMIEVVYASYRDLQRTMQHNARCRCLACQSITDLDLKFVCHFGEYALQTITGKAKPVGASVNLAHRLLKNSVRGLTGWRGYALFSDPCLDAMDVSLPVAQETRETYESLGSVKAASIDLNERYKQLIAERRIVVPQDDADIYIDHEFDEARSVVWDWMTDPMKRNIWFEGAQLRIIHKPGGRMGPSARYHCAKSDVIEEILDWRPFDYYSFRLSKGAFQTMVTCHFDTIGRGTRVRWIMRYDGPLPGWIGGPMTRLICWKNFHLKANFERMAHQMAHVDLPEAA